LRIAAKFPESWAEKSGKVMQLVEMAATNPVVAQILLTPDNMAMSRRPSTSCAMDGPLLPR